MQIACPRCRRQFRVALGAPPVCPDCGALSQIAEPSGPDAPTMAGGAEAPAAPSRPDPQGEKSTVRSTEAGRVIGGYRVLARLGRGGMSTVYKAEQVSLGRPVALKIPHREFTLDGRHLARFEQEARTLARLGHPNIVQVIDTGRDRDVYFIAMEFVEGTTLGRRIAERGPLGPRDGAALLRQCCAALARAHREKVVHRDIKPDNILISADGFAKVTDFGLAKILETDSSLSRTGTILGTPLYMSPEQADARPLDGRSDIYSLGATFYHAFTGRPPFEGSSPVSIALKHVKETPKPADAVNASVPPALAAVLAKMMAKRPEDRYASAEEVAAAVEGWERSLARSSGAPVQVPRSRVGAGATLDPGHGTLDHGHRTGDPRGRRGLILGGGIAAGFLIALALGWGIARRMGGAGRPPETEEEAASAARAPASPQATEPAKPPPPLPPEPDRLIEPDEPRRPLRPRPPFGEAPDAEFPGLFAGPGPEPVVPRKASAQEQFDHAASVADRRERMAAYHAVTRFFPDEQELGVRSVLAIARDGVAAAEGGEKMLLLVTARALKAGRQRYADYLSTHPETRQEFDRLARQAHQEMPPALRRPLDRRP